MTNPAPIGGDDQGYKVSDPELLQRAAHAMLSTLPAIRSAVGSMPPAPDVTTSSDRLNDTIAAYTKAVACLAAATEDNMGKLKDVGVNYQELEQHAVSRLRIGS